MLYSIVSVGLSVSFERDYHHHGIIMDVLIYVLQSYPPFLEKKMRWIEHIFLLREIYNHCFFTKKKRKHSYRQIKFINKEIEKRILWTHEKIAWRFSTLKYIFLRSPKKASHCFAAYLMFLFPPVKNTKSYNYNTLTIFPGIFFNPFF